jgi:L-threonylcarbamoyladenylate synthase
VKEEIEKAYDVLRMGGVILYPTDTVWGLGCDPTNDEAITKLLAIKNRIQEKSLLILVPNEALLQRYVKEIPEVCFDLLDASIKPLTIVYPDAQYISEQLRAQDNSIAIRLTKDPFCVQLMHKLKSGLVSTSANLSGEATPKNLKDVTNEIKEQVDYIVDLPNMKGTSIPSQIIKIKTNGEIEIIRK